MRMESLDDAINEAQRFIDKAYLYKDRHKDDGDIIQICGSKEAASVKRASLDLTRSLSEMRRP